MAPGDGVILLHGLARSAASMQPLADVLRKEGLRVLNLGYPSRFHGLAALADHVEVATARWRGEGRGAVHLVGHSLGGLLARAWIARHRPDRLGRLVMLGPPNGGSEIADLLSDVALYRRFFGPAGSELTTRHWARDALLGPVGYPVGVIAGTRAVDALGWLLLPRPNDGKVSVARTHLAGETAHLTLPVTHALMMRAPRVIAATACFLRLGHF